MNICLYNPHPNQAHRYTRQMTRFNGKITCREALIHYIPEPNYARLAETCLGFDKFFFLFEYHRTGKGIVDLEREVPPSDCLFNVIGRNQAIEELKTVV